MINSLRSCLQVVKEADAAWSAGWDAAWSSHPAGQISTNLIRLRCLFACLVDACDANNIQGVLVLLTLNLEMLRESFACLRVPPVKAPALKAAAATQWSPNRTRYQHAYVAVFCRVRSPPRARH